MCGGVAMPSRRPAGPCYSPVGCYRSGVSLRETGQPVGPGELLRESSESRRRLGFRKSSELKVQKSETSELGRGDQHQQIRFSSSSFGDKRIQLCQRRAKEVKRVTDLTKLEVYDERRMEEEEQMYATVRRVNKGEGEGFRPYQALRQPWGYQVK